MSALPRHVRVVGTGLIGASIGLALSRKGIDVSLNDASPTSAALARDLGAGSLAAQGADENGDEPDLVVVATPPDVAAQVVRAQLDAHPHAVVTDVASVKQAIASDLVDADLRRYVGSHPMAGRERSGAVAAQADLFEGRTWVICPGGASPSAVDLVRAVAEITGAAVVVMDADEHDAAVAAVSHVPQLAASLVAARLRGMPDAAVALSGQGIRDVTRIAASDPQLWTQILAGNAAAVAGVVDELSRELGEVAQALHKLAEGNEQGARAVLARTISEGQLGHARIPGKHGSAPTIYATVIVVIPDRSGQLGRLFNDIGEADINIEDLRLEHGVGMPVGVAEIDVLPAVAERLVEELTQKGWTVHE